MIGNRRGGRVFGRGGGVRTVPFCLFAVRLRRREGGRRTTGVLFLPALALISTCHCHSG